jgi:hypothetical protein
MIKLILRVRKKGDPENRKAGCRRNYTFLIVAGEILSAAEI